MERHGDEKSDKIYTSKSQKREAILRTIHDNGYLDLFKCQKEVRKRFWWAEWKNQIKELIEVCVR